MATEMTNGNGRRGSNWRIAGWGTAAGLLLAPLVAMQFTREVAWTGFDFAFAAILIGLTGLMVEFAVRVSGSTAGRAAFGIAIAVTFLLIWINLAVGIIGVEDNPANLMFAVVIAIGAAGAFVARFQPAGMARAMVAAAVAQAMVGGVSLFLDMAGVVMSAIFTAMLLASAALFRKAAGERAA
jgi:hypothetical protein